MRKKSSVDTKLESIKEGVSTSFEKVKEELDIHLDTINENTSEINVMQQYISILEEKIDKLSERLDELTIDQPYTKEINLSLREQEVFLTLYTAEKALHAVEIAKYLGLTEELVHSQVYRLTEKGVPIMKKFSEDKMCYFLDKGFKDLQARKNIIHINESVLQELQIDAV